MKTFKDYLAEQDNKSDQGETCPYCGRAKGPGQCMICGGGLGKTTGSIKMPKITSKAPVDKSTGLLHRNVRGPQSIK